MTDETPTPAPTPAPPSTILDLLLARQKGLQDARAYFDRELFACSVRLNEIQILIDRAQGVGTVSDINEGTAPVDTSKPAPAPDSEASTSAKPEP